MIPAFAAMAFDDVEELLPERRPRHDPVDEIRPVERSDELDRILQRELRGDVAPDAGGRRGRVSVERDAGQQLAEPSELAVLRPEIVTPLADAVRLVDRDEAHGTQAARRSSDRKLSPASPTIRSGDT